MLLSALAGMVLDQNYRWTLQKLSAVPLGATSEYSNDIVSTTELVYNLIQGSETATIVCQKLGCGMLVPSWCFVYNALL